MSRFQKSIAIKCTSLSINHALFLVAEPRPENEAANAENEGEANNQEASSSEASEQPAAPPAPVRPSFIRVLCTFVLSFFTSLVPQGPPPVQPN